MARTQYDYARMLRAREDVRDRRRSDALIADALREARTLGMIWLTARLGALARD